MDPLGVGIVLHPNSDYLDACQPLMEDHAEFFEVSPETLWQADIAGELSWSPWAELFEQIRDWLDKPFVAHGLGLSPGTAGDHDEERKRLERWLAQIRLDCERFDYLWYTEHLGWISAEGQVLVLPLPLPPTEEAAQTVANRLNLLRPILPTVGFENQVSYFTFTDPAEECTFWNRICEVGDVSLLLDLHNAYTQCVNYAADLDTVLSDLDLSRVLEIHLSGGSEINPAWLSSDKRWRLDTHDGPVPEPVWEMFARIRPHCPNLRAVVVERQNDSLTPETVELVREEVERAKRIFWE